MRTSFILVGAALFGSAGLLGYWCWPKSNTDNKANVEISENAPSDARSHSESEEPCRDFSIPEPIDLSRVFEPVDERERALVVVDYLPPPPAPPEFIVSAPRTWWVDLEEYESSGPIVVVQAIQPTRFEGPDLEPPPLEPVSQNKSQETPTWFLFLQAQLVDYMLRQFGLNGTEEFSILGLK